MTPDSESTRPDASHSGGTGDSAPRSLRAARSARRLGDVHEVVERELDRIRKRDGASDGRSWERDRVRLARLLDVERRLLSSLARERGLAP